MHFVHYHISPYDEGSHVYHPDASFGAEENAFFPLSHHMIEGVMLITRMLFVGLRNMHFAHYLTI